MRDFESEVQLIKYKINKQITKLILEERLEEGLFELAETIWPGPDPVLRCCIHKEHAIINKRAKLAVSKIYENTNVIEVIDIACDKCPVYRFQVTEACRGCLAHRCLQTCPKKAITRINGKAVIDQDICAECGKCKDVCPFGAIVEVMRPCKRACSVGAIEIGENKKAQINREKCINCGECVYQCPFGAISDRSDIVGIVKAIQSFKKDGKHPVYALVAPTVASQFNVQVGKVLKALIQIGFKDALEVALGADMIAWLEGKEFTEEVEKGNKPCIISSCCPAFVEHVQNKYPELAPLISKAVSPMIAMGRFVKSIDPDAVTVFIGPCISKKKEAKQKEISDAVDYVMTFEEMESIIDAYDVDLAACEDAVMDNASQYGRLFAASGGVAGAIERSIYEQTGKSAGSVSFSPVVCSGIKDCDKALQLLKANKLNGNFIEGMACAGGCIGGPVCLSHGKKNEPLIKEYASKAMEREIGKALRITDIQDLKLKKQE